LPLKIENLHHQISTLVSCQLITFAVDNFLWALHELDAVNAFLDAPPFFAKLPEVIIIQPYSQDIVFVVANSLMNRIAIRVAFGGFILNVNT
jgi:hypothetical protein